jgi:hypothetical protein
MQVHVSGLQARCCVSVCLPGLVCDLWFHCDAQMVDACHASFAETYIGVLQRHLFERVCESYAADFACAQLVPGVCDELC